MPLQRDAQHGVHAAVGVRGFKETDAAVVGVAHQRVELVLAEIALHRAAVASRAEGEARHFHLRFAQRHPVGRLGAVRQQRQRASRGERAGGKSGAEKFTSGSASHVRPPGCGMGVPRLCRREYSRQADRVIAPRKPVKGQFDSVSSRARLQPWRKLLIC